LVLLEVAKTGDYQVKREFTGIPRCAINTNYGFLGASIIDMSLFGIHKLRKYTNST